MLTDEQWDYILEQLNAQYVAGQRDISDFIAKLRTQNQVIPVPPKAPATKCVLVGSTFMGAPVLAEIEEDTAQAKKFCTCPMNLLLFRGCTCGGA